MTIRNYILVFLHLITAFIIRSQSIGLVEKIEITDKLIESIKENYVLQDSVQTIVQALENQKKDDKFLNKEKIESFAQYLTTQLRTITKDAHFYIMYNPQVASMLEQANDDGGQIDPSQLSLGPRTLSGERQNYFMSKVEVLDGNIGYFKINQMPSLSFAKSTLDAAMAFLANSDAIILDVRGNPGGVGGFIPYLMSYFFPADSTLLYQREMTAWDTISYHYSYKVLTGKRFVNRPTYILIDQFTGSAATNLAYTMQSFDRAILIGENTGSGYKGAHSASVFSFGHGLIGLIPIGRVVNAVTKTNWREEGVSPDIMSESSDALNTAYQEALNELLKTQTDEEIIKELTNIIEQEEKAISENDVEEDESLDDLNKYLGNYEGGRKVWVEDHKLKYIREGGSPLDLKKTDEHIYKIHLPTDGSTSSSLPSVKFNLNSTGMIESITLVFEDGRDPMGPFAKTK